MSRFNGLAFALVCQQFPWGYAEGTRDAMDVDQADVALPPLNAPYVCAVEMGSLGELLL